MASAWAAAQEAPGAGLEPPSSPVRRLPRPEGDPELTLLAPLLPRSSSAIAARTCCGCWELETSQGAEPGEGVLAEGVREKEPVVALERSAARGEPLALVSSRVLSSVAAKPSSAGSRDCEVVEAMKWEHVGGAVLLV